MRTTPFFFLAGFNIVGCLNLADNAQFAEIEEGPYAVGLAAPITVELLDGIYSSGFPLVSDLNIELREEFRVLGDTPMVYYATAEEPGTYTIELWNMETIIDTISIEFADPKTLAFDWTGFSSEGGTESLSTLHLMHNYHKFNGQLSLLDEFGAHLLGNGEIPIESLLFPDGTMTFSNGLVAIEETETTESSSILLNEVSIEVPGMVVYNDEEEFDISLSQVDNIFELSMYLDENRIIYNENLREKINRWDSLGSLTGIDGKDVKCNISLVAGPGEVYEAEIWFPSRIIIEQLEGTLEIPEDCDPETFSPI